MGESGKVMTHSTSKEHPLCSEGPRREDHFLALSLFCPMIPLSIISFDTCPFLTLVQPATQHLSPEWPIISDFWELWDLLCQALGLPSRPCEGWGHRYSGSWNPELEASWFTEAPFHGAHSLMSLLSRTPRGTVYSASLHLPRLNS